MMNRLKKLLIFSILGVLVQSSSAEDVKFEILWENKTRTELEAGNGLGKSRDVILKALEAIESAAASCKGCDLAESREERRVVVGVWMRVKDPNADDPELDLSFDYIGFSKPGSKVVLTVPPSRFQVKQTDALLSKVTIGAKNKFESLVREIRPILERWKSDSFDDLAEILQDL